MLLGISSHTSYAIYILPGIFISGLGFGLANVTAQNIIMSRVETKYAGIMGAVTNATSQIAMSLTVTVINSVIVIATATNLGPIGGYHIGIALAGTASLVSALLVAVFVCGRGDGNEVTPAKAEHHAMSSAGQM